MGKDTSACVVYGIHYKDIYAELQLTEEEIELLMDDLNIGILKGSHYEADDKDSGEVLYFIRSRVEVCSNEHGNLIKWFNPVDRSIEFWHFLGKMESIIKKIKRNAMPAWYLIYHCT